MTQANIFQTWQEVVQFGEAQPNPQKIIETKNFRAVIVGLKPGQKIPPHPAPSSIYHFLSGSGSLFVNGKRFAVQGGATITVPDGATRSIEAETELAFLGAQAAQIQP